VTTAGRGNNAVVRWTLALVGDVMLGRLVAERLRREPTAALLDDQVIEVLRSADITLANLECCISDRGRRWPDPRKQFFFRAPPVAAEQLARWGVDAVTLANNHALDYGADALVDTLRHLADAGVATVGAGATVSAARRPLRLAAGAVSVGVVACSDHPADYAATAGRPGIAYVDLRGHDTAWVGDVVATLVVDVTVVTPHWGPNMVPAPLRPIRAAALRLAEAGATLVAGHSVHVFHGVARVSGCPVLYDLGDFLDDYAVDPLLRNDLGLLWTVVFDDATPVRVEALPITLDHCATRHAAPPEARQIADRLRRACAELGTEVRQEGGRLVVALDG
jgi:poly-gamma-glutamate synthesis protein (capsule biosynthesis protein)